MSRNTLNQLYAGLVSGWIADYLFDFMSKSGRPKQRQWLIICGGSPTRYTALYRAPCEAPSEHVSSQCCSTAPRRGTRAHPGHGGTSLRKTYHQATSILYRE
ncbi:Uncharacterized protein HZ326_29595 [Fusarium oxysporum f. sp. albedinis]|nr:Uncharacterized protein HZ326_29595 [Fusarium oxysporum f. sp. albedinis]